MQITRREYEDLAARIITLEAELVRRDELLAAARTLVEGMKTRWVVLSDTDSADEGPIVFGLFEDEEQATVWAYEAIQKGIGGEDWCIRKVEAPGEIPEHKVEGTLANFDRYIAGDR
jgi:hypothetical protein